MISVADEQTKYRRMWTEVPGYRSTSPGENLVPMFLEQADWKPSDTLIDLGCGPGRAGLALSKAGLDVSLLDITETSRDSDPAIRKLPFVEACLWSHRVWPDFDWAYCCDVLEHIPPERVDGVLRNIAAMIRKGAFLQIALWSDGWGNKIQETLHLTVESAEWWQAKIEAHLGKARYWNTKDGRLVALI